MADKLELYIFYNPNCERCKPMHAFVHRFKREHHAIAKNVRIYWMNTSKATVQTIINRKYPCVFRIPTIVAVDRSDADDATPSERKRFKASSDIYWVGVPDMHDFATVTNYLALHEEGGKGAHE